MKKRMKETARASLLPIPATKTSESIPVSGGETTIGRAPSNTIQLTSGGVSRIHAVISHKNDQFILTDLDSKNGTFVNNKRIRQVVLQNSDKISFAKRGFMFFIEAAPSQPSAPDADPTSVIGDTITISEEGPELSKLLSHSAETAIRNFFELLSSDDDENPPTLQAHERLRQGILVTGKQARVFLGQLENVIEFFTDYGTGGFSSGTSPLLFRTPALFCR